MIDLKAAKEAAERLTTLSSYSADTRLDVSWQQICDLLEVKAGLLAILSDPLLLMGEPVWVAQKPAGSWRLSAVGLTYCVMGSGDSWIWWTPKKKQTNRADSLPAAQAACVADLRERIRPLFGKEAPHA